MTEVGTHPVDALAEYAAGTLSERSCRSEFAGWAALAEYAEGTPAVGGAPSTEAFIPAVLRRAAIAAASSPARRRGVRFAAQLLRAEIRLVRPAVWVASLFVLACAVGVAASGTDGGAGSTVLSLIAPLLAIAGVAAVYGPERDPAFEALAATVTSPRLVLLARVTVVFGYDLVLVVVASAVVRPTGSTVALPDLLAAWFGPTTLLLALCLVLAMWIGPNLAAAVAATLWVLRVLTIAVPGLATGWLASGMRAIWATSPETATATLALLAVAVAASRRPGRPGGGQSRPAAP